MLRKSVKAKKLAAQIAGTSNSRIPSCFGRCYDKRFCTSIRCIYRKPCSRLVAARGISFPTLSLPTDFVSQYLLQLLETRKFLSLRTINEHVAHDVGKFATLEVKDVLATISSKLEIVKGYETNQFLYRKA